MDIVERLRELAEDIELRNAHYADTPQFMRAGATEMARLREENKVLREALEWYGEQARLCRLIHSEGDSGRRALDADGGTIARTALATTVA